MQIIIVHPRLRRARALMLRPWWWVAASLGILLALAAGSGALSYATLKLASHERIPWLAELLAVPAGESAKASAADDQRAFVRQNLDALAVRLGELQARLTRLEAVGDRVAGIAGVSLPPSGPGAPGRGGAEPSSSRPLSMAELSGEIARLAHGVERRGDQFSLLENELILRNAMAALMPTSQPLAEGVLGSRFGQRIDPISGRSALHEGVDFNAPTGTQITAAGAGVVVFAGWHPGYGKQVDIDHGNALVTRYAHASRLLVKTGDIVRQGQKIAEVGSTGRSTGAHLHFEVRVGDEPRDPTAYLRDGRILGATAALARGASARR
ncbi:MAG: M23 family metallopeptidase [Burkholderiaceae bacterium]|nr:M23 family metallopeptidase [Burkholderiaceae bacterium]